MHIGQRALQFIESNSGARRALSESLSRHAPAVRAGHDVVDDARSGAARESSSRHDRTAAVLGRARAMHWMSNGSPLSREKPAQSPQIRMQARSKITVVDTLPKDVEARSIGFHGSTRDNFDSIKDMGVDFRRTGRNHEGFSMFGPGLYVTPQYGNAEDFAMRATTRDLRDNEDAEPEVAQVFVAKPDDKLVQADLPRDAKPGHPEMYEDVMRDAHLVNINHLASFITPRGAESEDVNFYVLRNQ